MFHYINKISMMVGREGVEDEERQEKSIFLILF